MSRHQGSCLRSSVSFVMLRSVEFSVSSHCLPLKTQICHESNGTIPGSLSNQYGIAPDSCILNILLKSETCVVAFSTTHDII